MVTIQVQQLQWDRILRKPGTDLPDSAQHIDSKGLRLLRTKHIRTAPSWQHCLGQSIGMLGSIR